MKTIVVIKDGPIMVEKGDEDKLNLLNESTDAVYEEDKYFLCRCGASEKKPFCDGTHKKINFKG